MIRNLFLRPPRSRSPSPPQPALAAPRKAHPPSSATLPASNPFAQPSTLPFETPDFSKIKDSDYLPALLAGMAQQKREVTAIANNRQRRRHSTIPSSRWSVRARCSSARNLAFSAVNGANTNDTLQATDTKTAPLFAAHNDFIYLNPKLFERFKTLHDSQASLNLNPEQAKLLDVYYKQFVHAGAQLPPAKQAELKAINKRLARCRPSSARSCLPRPRRARFTSTTPAALAGLSRAAARGRAAGRQGPQACRAMSLPLQNTTQQPALESLTSHDTRQKLLDASLNRAEHGDANDTRAIVSEIAQLRAKKAALFGYSNFADYNALRPDGEEPRDGGRLPRPAGSRRFRQGAPGMVRHRRARQVRRARPSSRPRPTGTSMPSRSARAATRSTMTS